MVVTNIHFVDKRGDDKQLKNALKNTKSIHSTYLDLVSTHLNDQLNKDDRSFSTMLKGVDFSFSIPLVTMMFFGDTQGSLTCSISQLELNSKFVKKTIQRQNSGDIVVWHAKDGNGAVLLLTVVDQHNSPNIKAEGLKYVKGDDDIGEPAHIFQMDKMRVEITKELKDTITCLFHTPFSHQTDLTEATDNQGAEDVKLEDAKENQLILSKLESNQKLCSNPILLVTVPSAEFIFSDTSNSMNLVVSSQGLFCYTYSKETLEYDLFGLDSRWESKMLFEKISILREMDKSIVEGCSIQCEVSGYSEPECELDFSKPIPENGKNFSDRNNKLWGSVPRQSKTRFILPEFYCSMDSDDYHFFMKMTEFIKTILSPPDSDTIKEKEEISSRSKQIALLKELKEKGKEGLKKYLKRRLQSWNMLQSLSSSWSSSFEYHFSMIQMNMKSKSSTLRLIMTDLQGYSRHISSLHTCTYLAINDIEIDNPKALEGEADRVLKFWKGRENKHSVEVNLEEINVPGENEGNIWRIANKYEIQSSPISLNIDEVTYNELVSFFVPEQDSIEEHPVLDSKELYLSNPHIYMELLKSKKPSGTSVELPEMLPEVPTYYSSIAFKNIQVLATFRSGSSLLNFNKLKLDLSNFEETERLWNSREMVQKLGKWALKKGAWQVVQNRIFGVRGTLMDEDR